MKRVFQKAIYLVILFIIPIFIEAQSCDSVKLSDFPAKDLPTAGEKASLQKLESYKYYYGIGVPIDYIKARKIAFIEISKNPDNQGPFEGYSILIMIYANGYGVKKDLDLCIRLACANVGGATAEIEGRTEHLKDMKNGKSKDIFDLCDDITSGYMEGFCSGVASEFSTIKRDSTINAIIKKWPDSERVAFNSLRKSAKAFFEWRAGAEVDESGTARAAMQIDESDSLNDNFLDKTRQAAKCVFKEYTQQEFEKADQALNAIYQKLMKGKEFPEPMGITKDSIKNTQRWWIEYRDAWVRFLAVRCSKVSANSIKTLLTRERISQLKELVEFQQD